MQTIIQSINDPSALKTAHLWLMNSHPIAFPTDTIYGIGCLYHDTSAINRIYQIKERSPQKALAVLIGSIEHMKLLSSGIPDPVYRLAEKFWPGALTLILPIKSGLPDNLSPYPTIGIRMPDHPVLQRFINTVGPLANSSANISGGSNPTTAQQVSMDLNGKIPFILDGGPTQSSLASTVVDCTKQPLQIIREGAIKAADIFA